ncbi:PAS domain S-box-containing protein/diguanylate cyclase (GGDEF) domain-containing protein [Modicisalibacter ilicicola DSM 19980]|uniref:PAS domain S-box-containing protein/diguanylate cyclase (GGDEF) domain-containing protein n=1 Tax=Modicisalibacter ilicicola DSM 19980 TaxID=1121942 RepID=A0A1M5BME5_9GAMM|nr:GGDEF domain-containing phosphodiesterase [Halomonas ilicicola]SHF43560.1 PAS domain S-box-containing protein/diguanylate cyclase (GGDEF) domain-containing protein [Halomonas ilicicola DSM 19980]
MSDSGNIRYPVSALLASATGASFLAIFFLDPPWWVLGLPAILLAALAASGRPGQPGKALRIESDIEQVKYRHRESEQRFRALLESLPKVAVQGYDKDRRVIYWNEASCRLYGYTRGEATGRLLEELLIPDGMKEHVIAAHRAWVEEGKEITASELELKHKSGAPVAVFSHHVMLGEHTSNPLMFCVDVDLSDQKQAQRELDFVMRFDALTGLPNRQSFEADLATCLDQSPRGDQLAVIFIGIDRFAEINDAHGYTSADEVLTLIAHRLRRCQRGNDLLARFGGDEFVMALPALKSSNDVLAQVEGIHQALSQPLMLREEELYVTSSAGISLFPDNGTTASELIHNAVVAKNRAKLGGRDNDHFFDERFHRDVQRRHELTRRLRNALRHDEFVLHYQPQVAARSGRIESFETLLRWFPEEGPAVSTAELIEVAEYSELIHPLGDWIMLAACRQQASWKARGLGGRRIDINLSGKQLAQEGVLQRLEAHMADHGLTAQDIGIELTENVLIQASDRILAGLNRLYHKGMKIALDDFGTGYSSLSYLKQLPVTSIKIDRTFVRDAPSEPRDRAIMEATVFIGHRLGLEVVAEGVENEAQLELVQEMGCDLVQGYHFFKPMSSHEAGELIALPAASGTVPIH